MAATAANAYAAGYSVYWTNLGGNTISRANSDGSGGETVPIDPAFLSSPRGISIDRSTGALYWANSGDSTIGVSDFDGGNAHHLNTSGVTLGSPSGVAVDTIGGRVYWAGSSTSTIEYANLDGSGGGGTVDTTGATVQFPQGVTIDRVTNRIYWSNDGSAPGGHVGYASLDGSGPAGMLPTSSSGEDNEGISSSGPLQQLFFGSYSGGAVFYAAADGSGGGTLDTTGASTGGVGGTAVDTVNNRVYWTSYDGSIGYANADNTGSAADLSVSGSGIYGPWGSPALGILGNAALSPDDTHEFTSQTIGTTSAPFTYSLTNNGDDYLTFGKIAASGGNASAFPSTSNCPIQLAPGSSCSINVSFSPGQSGTSQSFLNISTDSGVYGEVLRGSAPATPDSPTLLQLTGVKVSKRCSSSSNAGKLKVDFKLTAPATVKVTLQRRTAGRPTPRRCPTGGTSPHKPSSQGGRVKSGNVGGYAGKQSIALLKTLRLKTLAPGHYRVKLTATADNGAKTPVKGGWVWILAP
jgi:DNA-binding beta-propeller fold protein YncE